MRHPVAEPRRDAQMRLDARPGDPRTNTRPRGNGPADRREVERCVEKLGLVLGH